MGFTFVSYSRKQLYFAESIALHLQQAGIETWFDLQQLGAGADWATTLKAGYENCERLVLVVSQAALASPYVEVEWDTALKNGREVILVVVEDVDIPEKLYGRPTFDFRGDFDRAMELLASYLTGNLPAQHDPIQPPGRFPVPLQMPPAIWAILAALILPYVWAVFASLSSLATAQASTGALLALGTVVLGGGVFYLWTRRFWQHDLDYGNLRYLLLFALAVALVVLFDAVTSRNAVSVPILVVTTGLNVFAYFWLLNRSAALLRWFPAGGIPQQMRRRLHGKLVKNDGALKEESVQFAPVRFFAALPSRRPPHR